MKKIGIEIDYSNICKDYNTSYLDRDNMDPATSKCMKEVLFWTKHFLSELLENFEYNLYHLCSESSVKIEDIASKRFLFYSLEKEITLQSYVLQKSYVAYDGLNAWGLEKNDSILLQNDVDGGGIYLFVNENSKAQQWILAKLKDFSLDEVPFPTKS